MGKRFTDTQIWEKEWFMKLSPRHKCLWRYLTERCDQSGVWEPNWQLASIYIGESVSKDDLKQFDDQIEILQSGKIFIVDFVKFQYGNLSQSCAPHTQIIKLLEKHNLTDRFVINDYINNKSTIRKRVTEKKKVEIFSRDEYRCQYCGDQKSRNLLVIDHVIPISKGGQSDDDNLVTSCVSCNAAKSDKTLADFLREQNIPLETLSKKLNRVFKDLNTLKEKDKEKEVDNEKEIFTKKEKIENDLTTALDDLYLDRVAVNWGHIDFKQELSSFRDKVNGAPETYNKHGPEGIRSAFISHLRSAKKVFNKPNTVGKFNP